MGPIFLNLEMVLRLHSESIKRFGGGDGIRDQGALESALAAPLNFFHYEGEQQDFEGHIGIAAHYWYHISQNHPFIDGNKRTAFASAAVYLEMNGYSILPMNDVAIELGLSVASSHMSKEELTEQLANIVVPN